MREILSPSEDVILLAAVDRLCQEVVGPSAAAVERKGEFPWAWYKAFAAIGLLTMRSPADGSPGVTTRLAMRVYERLGRSAATASLILSNSVETAMLIRHGLSAPLANLILANIEAGDAVPCFCLTEPGAGSDVLALQSTARRTPTGYHIAASKAFCTNGSVGRYFVVFALTDPEAARSRRLSAFLVDNLRGGVTIERVEPTMGLRGAPLTTLTFDTEVPAENRLGSDGDGLQLAMLMLNEARLGAAAQCIGIASAALDLAATYVQERRAFGKSISEFQAVQFRLADMAMHITAARSLVESGATAADAGREDEFELKATTAKVLASEMATWCALQAIQLLGGTGYLTDMPAERFLREAKAYEIFDGANEIHRWQVGRRLLRGGAFREAVFGNGSE
jgi:alkylation response protein AidB-like acyl-CoA dehydrogenase